VSCEQKAYAVASIKEAAMVRPLLALLPLLAFSAPVGSQTAALPVIAITESNFRIAPGIIHLAAGQPVRLVFTNLSGGGHDFTAPAFFRRATQVSGPVEGGEVELLGHAQQVVTLVPTRGTYRAHCTHFAHSMMGMKAVIVVD